MTSGRDFFGRGGLAALVVLVVYLLALSGVLLGTAVPLLVLLAAATVVLILAYLKNPDRFHRLLARLRAAWQARPRRQPAPPRPAPAPRSAPLRQGLIATAPARSPDMADRRGLTSGSPLLRALLGRGWRSPAAMARDFLLIGLAGAALLLTGLALPDWPLLSWLGKVFSMLGVLIMLISSGVVYSYWRGRS
ncbi:hypothetical protein [Rhodovulum steppense]|uniref:Uncharacterized protein n=1 Tax=Rhodovulum steppense TaxID=540251 RepID=A0A4R1Z2C3_9RHOB|nr:hypothetical protein [Rhodovulum steppense]TCM87526.1 hypothetical protein EV216_10279 [Rhodovulum steppense]